MNNVQRKDLLHQEKNTILCTYINVGYKATAHQRLTLCNIFFISLGGNVALKLWPRYSCDATKTHMSGGSSRWLQLKSVCLLITVGLPQTAWSWSYLEELIVAVPHPWNDCCLLTQPYTFQFCRLNIKDRAVFGSRCTDEPASIDFCWCHYTHIFSESRHLHLVKISPSTVK